MYKATCSTCGKETWVPFRPIIGRPIYCKECFYDYKHRKRLINNQNQIILKIKKLFSMIYSFILIVITIISIPIGCIFALHYFGGYIQVGSTVVGIGYDQYNYITLNKFQTINECIGFLKTDKTNTLVWTSTFTCDNFSKTLVQNAKDKGYYLQYHIIEGQDLKNYEADYISYLGGSWGQGTGHAVCSFNIEERRFVVEPQTDVILEEINGRYVGLYRGEN